MTCDGAGAAGDIDLTRCALCPRRCSADRRVSPGFCRAGANIDCSAGGNAGASPDPANTLRIARASLHYWEEPCISGPVQESDNIPPSRRRGSGTIFFSGCPLKCVFCQNRHISIEAFGRVVTVDGLCDIMLRLRDSGAYNINLVSPTQFIPQIASALRAVKGELAIPVIYNTGGYELPSSLRLMDGLVDVWLPDFKYCSPDLAAKYSAARDYPQIAAEALRVMYSLSGDCVFDSRGMILRGVIVRHLVLPGCRRDSIEVLRRIADIKNEGGISRDIRVSIMSQYTPPSDPPPGFPAELLRTLTSFEYSSVLAEADRLSLSGYRQYGSPAGESFIPAFDMTGV